MKRRSEKGKTRGGEEHLLPVRRYIREGRDRKASGQNRTAESGSAYKKGLDLRVGDPEG